MRVLVLSGGANKGAVQIGILRELLEENPLLDYDAFVGISVGALNSSLLATGPLQDTLPKLEKIWLEDIKGNNSIWQHRLWKYILIGICVILLFTIAGFISFLFTAPKWLTLIFGLLALASFYLPYYFLMHVESVYDTSPLRKMVENNLDLELLRNSGKELRIGSVCVETGEYRTSTQRDENIYDYIMASAAFPVFFPTVKIDGFNWTDGGVINISPFSDALNLQPDSIDVILASPISLEAKDDINSLPAKLMRIIDIMSTEILKNDLYTKCYGKSGIKIRVFMPEKSFGVSSLSFDPEKIREMYQAGRYIVREKKYFEYT